MYDPDAFRHIHEKSLEAAGIGHIRSHDLRHTFATLSLQNGVDVKTLSNTLGHYSAGFTLDTYTHATQRMRREAADTIYQRQRHRPGNVKKAENGTGPDGDPRPGLLSLDISKAQSYITDFLVIDRKFFGCGPSIIPIFRPVRSAPQPRMGHGLGQGKMAEINRSKKVLKNEEKPCKSHRFARLWWRLQNSNL